MKRSTLLQQTFLIASLCFSSLLTGCDSSTDLGLDSTNEIDSPAPPSAPSPEGDILSKIAGYEVGALYSGVRSYKLHTGDLAAPTVEHYKEEVASDGTGQFALEVIDLIEPQLSTADEDLQLLLLSTRGAFLFRYRGFGIRDIDWFRTQYTVVDTGQTVTVAGHPGSLLLIELTNNPTSRFEVVVEPNTGIVLKSTELSLSGLLISEQEFESLDLNPNFDSTVWHVPGNSEVELSAASATAALSFPLLQPTLLPAGYRELSLSRIQEPVDSPAPGRAWAKQVYTDGVHLLFFNYTEVEQAATVDATVADEMRRYRRGALGMLEGTVRDYHVTLMGEVSDLELGQTLQSALPVLR